MNEIITDSMCVLRLKRIGAHGVLMLKNTGGASGGEEETED